MANLSVPTKGVDGGRPFSLDKRIEIYCPWDQTKSTLIIYYEGHYDSEPASFLYMSGHVRASTIYTNSRDSNNPHIMFASWLIRLGFFDDYLLDDYLIGFVRFRDLSILFQQRHPDYVDNMIYSEQEYPRDYWNGMLKDCLKKQLKGIIGALMAMAKISRTSTMLGTPLGFVWCCGTVRILMVNACISDVTNTRVPSYDIPMSDLRGLRNFLQYCLLRESNPPHNSPWIQMEDFMEAIVTPRVYANERLQMLLDHPFLQSKEDDLDSFSKMQVARSSIDGVYLGRQLQPILFSTIINDWAFCGRFVIIINQGAGYQPGWPHSPGWESEQIGKWKTVFEAAYNYQRYDKLQMEHLLRFLRNLCIHYRDKLSIDDMYDGIERCWPGLMGKCFVATRQYR